jgi:hypothetical protein
VEGITGQQYGGRSAIDEEEYSRGKNYSLPHGKIAA